MKASKDDNLPGSFFNQVPEGGDEGEDKAKNQVDEEEESDDPFDKSFAQMIQKRKAEPLASKPSTINGKPTKGKTMKAIIAILPLDSTQICSTKK